MPVSLSERTCDIIDYIHTEDANEVNIDKKINYKDIDMTIRDVNSYTFSGNKYIKKANINITDSIGSYIFSNCSSLTSVTIGNSIKTIGRETFKDCNKIKQITVEAVTPPECSYKSFDGINTNECKLIVPKNSIDAYKKADRWKEFFLIEGSTTGIINNIYNKIGNVDVYTIDGVKCLSKASVNEINALPKGVYIINGKKIVIK